jgi:cation diffusion facilitator family transporter
VSDKAQRERAIGRTHALGVVTNAALAALKLAIGSLAGSRALVADGLHSISDVLMTGAAWLSWRWSERPRDADHHYGHGHGEALATLVVGIIVIAVGLALMWSSIAGTPSSVGADWLGLLAVAAEAITIIVKLALARATARAGARWHSSLLTALARDSRADVLTSGLVLLAIVGTIAGLRWLEPLAALAIGLLIGVEGLRSAWEGIGVLMDRHANPELDAALRTRASAVAGVLAVDDLRVHPLGTHLRIDMEISVERTIDVAAGHAIAHAVEAALIEAYPQVREVAVHVNPM